MRCLLVASVVVAAVALIACGDSRKAPPQVIEADGQTFYACKDTIYIDNETSGFFGGDLTFRVKFTDGNGYSHVMKGIRKLHVSEAFKDATFCK